MPVLLPKKPAEKIFSLSYSKAKTWESCPAKYKFSYIEKLPKKEWDFTKFGKFLHETLENGHRLMLTDSRPVNEIFTEVFKAAIIEWSPTPEQKKEGFELLKTYLRKWVNRVNKPQILGIEKEFNIIFDDKFLLGGFIDRVDYLPEEDLVEIIDYKTAKNSKYLSKDYLQLQTYAFALWLENPNLKRFRCSYLMLREESNCVSMDFNLDEILQVEKIYLDYFESVTKDQSFTPKAGPLCKFCDWVESPGCPAGKTFISRLANTGSEPYPSGFVNWS